MSTNSESQVSLKLLIDKQTRKLVYGEAGKEFVDFLLTILSLPLGTVTMLLSKNNMVGCLASLGSLYQSIENLNDTYIIQSKSSILNPEALYSPTKNTTLLSTDGQEGGFVKGAVIYMIMDNLEVKPMSTVSIVATLNKFNIKDVGALEEKVIRVSSVEVLCF
ncbi:hypothetical protein LINPERPRIM_LOCUS4139 [Linum perenne]